MKAIRVHETGGPEALQLNDIPMPEPGPGEARIKVAAAGLNFIDVYQRMGIYPLEVPFVPGGEAAGVVEAVGPDVADLAPGDRVAYAMHTGSYSDYAVIPSWKLVPVPHEVDLNLAAAVMLQGLTAHYLTYSTYELGPEDTALIHAAAGGVGHLLVQLARQRGARIIATVSNEEKAQLAQGDGADEVILYTQTDFEAETKRLTDGRGVDVVYDSVGVDTFDKSLNCLRPRGYMVLYGASSGPVPPMDPQTLNLKGSLYLTRPSLGVYMADREELLWRANDLFTMMAEGNLNVRVDQTFPLADAAEAHRYLEGRQTKGKVLIIP
jgi:NADPH2:quinone reductase